MEYSALWNCSTFLWLAPDTPLDCGVRTMDSWIMCTHMQDGYFSPGTHLIYVCAYDKFGGSLCEKQTVTVNKPMAFAKADLDKAVTAIDTEQLTKTGNTMAMCHLEPWRLHCGTQCSECSCTCYVPSHGSFNFVSV